MALVGKECDERRNGEPEQSLHQKEEKAPDTESLDPVLEF